MADESYKETVELTYENERKKGEEAHGIVVGECWFINACYKLIKRHHKTDSLHMGCDKSTPIGGQVVSLMDIIGVCCPRYRH